VVREIQVELDRAKLEGMNLSIDKVAQAVKIAHMDTPGGSLKDERKEYGVRTLGRSSEIKNIDWLMLELY
jgi:multidrug efflux pump subunit AcrB